MNMNIRTTLLMAAIAAVTALAACTTPSAEHSTHAGMMREGHHASMDMAQMCSRHQQMMSGKTSEQQRELMESHMKAMHGDVDPKMVEMHRQMMEKDCATR
jgi:Spy/CpxP family protein refolding chaperone